MDYDLDDWKMILATISLIICMLWDIALHVAQEYLKVKISSCIPTNLFVLGALTIQILGYVQIQKIQVFGPSNEKELELLVSEQLKMDVARLTMCVFVGCLLPGMAMAGTQGRWSNIAALFVSLSFHIATEIYVLQNANNYIVQREAGPWFISSGALLLLGASSLLLLLGSVILSGKLARDGVRYGISQVLSKDVENEGDRWEKLRSEMMKSWVAARAWKTRYFITSSAFSPGAGMIVTICIAFMTAKLRCRLSLLHNNERGNLLIFYLQCIFILVGWILMLWRWFKAGLYCSFSIENMQFIKASTRARHFFSVPAAVVVSPICPRLAYFLLNPKHRLRNILVSVSCFVPLLPLYVLILAISLLCLFCFICRYFSVLILSSQFVQCLCKLDKESVLSNDEHLKYDSILASMGLPEVDFQHIFWKVNRRSYERIKCRMDDCKMRQRRIGLLSIMGNGRLAQNPRLQSIKKSWVGTISTIFNAIAELEIDVDMENAFAAYRETVNVLKFVDYPDNIVVDPFNSLGTLNFYALRDSIHFEGEMREVERMMKQGLGTPDLEEKRERIDEMLRDFRHKLERSDERASNSLLIRLEECSYYNVEELGELLRALVGHVIISGLLEASDLILKCTKQWTQNVDEKKIERAIELAAMVNVLLEDIVEDGDILFSINEV
ncbi:hypothetical protein SUGI_0211950 [Cryptomeria japonica]|nr:hypothetical protein SUGI_0211950 [Cryptomeria japonica]